MSVCVLAWGLRSGRRDCRKGNLSERVKPKTKNLRHLHQVNKKQLHPISFSDQLISTTVQLSLSVSMLTGVSDWSSRPFPVQVELQQHVGEEKPEKQMDEQVIYWGDTVDYERSAVSPEKWTLLSDTSQFTVGTVKGIFRCKFNPCSNTPWHRVRPPPRETKFADR